MSCYVPYANLEQTLLTAYRQDFEKYKNLSEVIDSVMNLPLAGEAKIHAVWFYAGYVNSAALHLEQLQTPEWKNGTYSKLHNYLKPFLNGEKEFDYDTIVEKIKGFFPKAAPASTDVKADIEAKIKNLLSYTQRGQILLAGEDYDLIKAVRENPTDENVKKFLQLYKNEIGKYEQSIVDEVNAELTALGAAPETPTEVEEVESDITTDDRTIIERINDEINDLTVIADESVMDTVNSVINMIKANTSELDGVVIDPQNTTTGEFLKLLRNTVALRKDSSTKYSALSRIEAEIRDIMASFNRASVYFDLASTEGVGMHRGNPIIVLTRRTGEMMEVVYDPEVKQIVHWSPDDSKLHLKPYSVQPGDHQVTVFPEKNNDYMVNGSNMNMRLHRDELTTGLIIPSNNDKMQGEMAATISAEAPTNSSFQNTINIVAHTREVELNNDRMTRLNREFPNQGRSHETMERPNQREQLRIGNGPILTFLRPTTGFSIRISNLNNTASFNLETLANLAVVYPDNIVVPFDTESAEHVAMLYSMVEGRETSDELQGLPYFRLNDAQVEAILDNIRTYREFEKEVMDKMSVENVSEMDIKDIFNKYYVLANNLKSVSLKKGEEIPVTTLSNYIEAHDGLLPAKLQDYDADGNPVGVPYSFQLPVVMRKIDGAWRMDDSMVPENSKLVTEKGEQYNGVNAFIKAEFGIDYLSGITGSMFSSANSVFISFRKDGVTYRPVVVPLVYDKNIMTVKDNVDFAGVLIHSFLNSNFEEGNRFMELLNNKYWGFDVVYGDQIRPQFTIVAKNRDGSKVYGVRFYSLPEMEESKKAFFDKNVRKYDLVINSSDLNAVNSALNALRNEAGITIPAGASTTDAQRLTLDAFEMLGEEHPLVKAVTDSVNQMLSNLKKEYLAKMKQHNTDVNDMVLSERLFSFDFVSYSMFDNGKIKLRSRQTKKEGLTRYHKLETVKEDRALTLSPARPPRLKLEGIYTQAMRPKVTQMDNVSNAPTLNPDPVTPAEDPSVVSDTNFEVDNLNDIESTDNTPPFSLVDSLEAFMTLSDKDFIAEINAMKRLIPDAFTFTEEGFEGLNVDGHALGYVQGLMVHLNGTLKAKGVAYHEGFHAVFRRLLTDKQQAFYLKKAGETLGDYKTDSRGKYIQVGSKKVYASEFREQRRYGHLNDEQIKNLIYEEYLADGFAEYMDKNKAPRTWMEKLFKFLKGLLNIFKKGNVIDALYYDISLGKFRTAPILDYQGPNNEIVWSLDFKGVPTAVLQTNNKVSVQNQVISAGLALEVKQKVLSKMATLEAQYPQMKMREIYDLARKEVLRTYDIQNLVKQNPAMESEIITKYGNEYDNARWLLGGLLENQVFHYLNLTKLAKYDNQQILGSKSQLKIAEANAKSLRATVMDEYRSFTDLEDSTVAAVDPDEMVVPETSDDIEVKDSFYEGAGVVGAKPDEGNSTFRKMFKLIAYEQTDQNLGIKVTKMVDATNIFSTIMKITSDLDKTQILDAIVNQIDSLDLSIRNFEDNIRPNLENTDEIPLDFFKMMKLRDSLKAVYDTLVDVVGLDAEGRPTKNHSIFNMFLDVFNVGSVNLKQVDLQSMLEFTEDAVMPQFTGSTSRVSDIVIAQDMNKIRTEIKDRITALNMTPQEAKDIIRRLKDISDDFSRSSLSDNFFNGPNGTFNDAAFNNYLNALYVDMSKLKLGIPYSVLYASFGFNAYVNNGRDASKFPKNSPMYLFLKENKKFFSNFGQAPVVFWSESLPNAISNSLKITANEKMAMNNLAFETSLKRFAEPYLKAFGEFIIKYDPTIAGSSTRNSNGDLVYKYIKQTREMILVRKLQEFDNIEDGFNELVDSPYYYDIRNFFENNPMLDISDPMVRTFLENLKIDAFAGFKQNFRLDNKFTEGEKTTFKSIDDRAFMMSMIGLFLDESMHYVQQPGGQGVYMTTFKRILTVFEATSTSMVTDGRLTRYYTNDNQRVMENGKEKTVVDLIKALRQEYEMIRSNFANKGENIKRYLKYNDTDSGRAFKFNIFRDFFDANPEMEAEFIAAAKEGTSFDALNESKSDSVLMRNLEMGMREFAKTQYETFLAKFAELGLTLESVPTSAEYDASDLPGASTMAGVENKGVILKEFFFNNWINSLMINQLFDGYIGLGVKDFANYFKRQKAGAAAGSSLYNPMSNPYGVEPTYRIAVMSNVRAYLDNSDPLKPLSPVPYYEEKEDEQGRKIKDPRNKEIEVFDGQTVQTMFRRMAIEDSRGRLNRETASLMMRMMYETRDTEEYRKGITTLKKRGIVFNSQKTVTATPSHYLKHSEHALIRKNYSMLRKGLDYDQSMSELSVLYDRILDYRYRLDSNNDIMIPDPETGQEKLVSTLYEETVRKAHSYFEPLPNREFWHYMLNSMELHGIAQLMDPNASKKATVVPLTVDHFGPAPESGYYDLQLATDNIPNDLTFIQVPTEKDATMVSQGIQNKLLVIAGLDPTDAEYKNISKDIENYQKGLKNFVDNQLNFIKRMFDKGDEKMIARLYMNISAGLKEMGGDTTMLQWFELTPEGKPKYNPNVETIAPTIINYYFSLFNKNLFDRKIAGRKYYHISPFGHNVLEQDGKVITTEEYKKAPTKYANAKVRPLSYQKREDGTYYVEVIVPKELQDVDQKFLEEYLSEFFATRIPTEGIRSMVVAKVVDYIDEAYGSGIIVPSQVHLLAGSDFDIDAFYAHVRHSYRSIDGKKKMVYGNYSHYVDTYGMTLKEAKFMEYLTYISKDDLIQPLLKAELRRIKHQKGYIEEQAQYFGELFGGKIEDFFRKNSDIMTKEETGDDIQDDMIETFRKVIATYNILSDMKRLDLPSDPDELETYTSKRGSPVMPLTMNSVLESKLKILSDPNVYKKFMEADTNRADAAADPYKLAVDKKGLTETEIYKKQNVYTPTAMIVARSLNSESKDSLGISASFNKGVSMLQTIKARLEKPAGLVYVINENGKYDEKIMQEVGSDAVELVGGAVGVFADAANNPYPGPLHLTRETAPIMLAMYAIGWPQQAAILFQSLPYVKKMIAEFKISSGSSYTENPYAFTRSFKNFVNDAFSTMMKDEDLFNEMVDQNIIKFRESGEDKGKPYVNRYGYKLRFDFNLVKPDEPNAIATTQTNGFTITNKFDVPFIDNRINDFIILNELKNYNDLASSISFKITSLTNGLKGLKPDMDNFDRLIETFNQVRQNKIKEGNIKWTNSTITNLFTKYPVLRSSLDALKYMDEMSKIILLERTSMFKAMSQLLNQSTTYGYNSSEIARDLKSYLAMQMQRVEMQNNSESILGELFLNQVDPDTFTSGDIISDFNSLRSRYPNNAFLESIKIVDIGTTRRPVRVLEFHTTRLSPERRDMVYTDLLNLMGSNVETDMMGPDNTPIKVTDKERAFRIAYHGMIKSGGKRGIGTYHQVLPAILSSPMSNALNKFQKGIIKLDERIKNKWDASVIEGENGKLVIPDEAKQEYAAGLRDILANTFAGRSADDIFTDAFTKIVSMKISDGTIEPYKRMVSVKKMEKYDIKVTNDFFVKFFNMITPGSAPNIINEKGVGQRLKISSKYKMDSGEYELFTPSDKELSIDLNHPDMKLDAQKQVLSYFGIRYNPGFDNFSFPLFKVNAYGQIMILKSIDNDSLGTRFIDSLYLAPFTNSQLTDLSGNSAVYEVVPMEGVARVSPLAFTSLEGAMIRNIAMGQVQQISSKKMIDVPPGMNIISSQNRMWMFNESDTLDRDYTNKTMSTVDFNIVNTGERAYHFEMNRNNSIVQVNKDGSVFAVNPQSYDMLAQRLGKASWADVIADPQFEDFLSGKTNIFMFELINGDIQTPVTPVSQPAAPVSQPSAPEAQPTSVKPTIEVGRYVRYKDSEYIITKIIKENLVQIYTPLKEGPNSKLTVSPSNLTFVDIKAQMVEYKDKQYLVTPRNSIISLTTNKIMQWGEENGDRRAILELAAQARESTGIDIEKLKQQREEVIKQKTDESRNCNNPKT